STSSVLSTEKDESAASKDGTTEVASKSQEGTTETPKQKLLDIIGNMKVEVSYRKKLRQLKAQETKKLEGPGSEGRLLFLFGFFFSITISVVSLRGKPLDPELVEAASAVASSLPHNKRRTESELLAQLRRHEETTDKQRKGSTFNIRHVISEMAVKRQSPAQRGVRMSNLISLELDEDGQRIKRDRLSDQSFESKRSLKVGKRLNIFTKASTETENALEAVSSPTIWDVEFAKQIAAVTAQPPRNGFEEMIQWTKEGILWEFPIDNEAGMCPLNFYYLSVFIFFELEHVTTFGCFNVVFELSHACDSKQIELSKCPKLELLWVTSFWHSSGEVLQVVSLVVA
ncbi:RT31 protein, partial [Atlantisia rogersi]|nr:RT31 protein [Atlantisia rogersi]